VALRPAGGSRCRRYLDNNALTGSLPTELMRLTAMTRINVYNNSGLCGDILSLGTFGTNYWGGGTWLTALGTACPGSSLSPTTTSPPPPPPWWETLTPTFTSEAPTTTSAPPPLVLSVKLEDNTAYRACLAIPANCGQLYAARSSSPGHACASRGNRGACDALVTAERVWGVMQAPVQPRRGALGHHSHGGGVVHGSLGPVRTATALLALLTHGGC
jgi:hypothetical protein